MTKVAILDDYQGVSLTLADWSLVTAQAEVVAYRDHVEGLDALLERLDGVQVVVLMRERTPITAALLERLPNLRLIVTTGRTNAAIDLAAAAAHGVSISYATAHQNNTAYLAELTWALILAAARDLMVESRALRAGGWQASLGSGLSGRRLGLLGLGKIGTNVARIGLAFGMTVSAWSENLAPERAADIGVRAVGKDELFAESDVLSIHLRLSDRTVGLVGAHELSLMKPTAILVNTARGQLVDEPSLINALRTGLLRGAGLDTFDHEPLPDDHPFRSLPNVIATPHIGYVTRQAYELYYRAIVEDIVAFLAGHPIRLIE